MSSIHFFGKEIPKSQGPHPQDPKLTEGPGRSGYPQQKEGPTPQDPKLKGYPHQKESPVERSTQAASVKDVIPGLTLIEKDLEMTIGNDMETTKVLEPLEPGSERKNRKPLEESIDFYEGNDEEQENLRTLTQEMFWTPTIPVEETQSSQENTQFFEDERNPSETKRQQNPKSNIVTLEPHKVQEPKKNKNKRRQEFKRNPILEKYDQIFSNSSWPRFLSLRTNEDILKAEVEYLLLNECGSSELKFRKTKTNEWIIETTSEQQSKMLQRIKKSGKYEVQIEKHHTLNSTYGTILIADPEELQTKEQQEFLRRSLKIRHKNILEVDFYQQKSKKTPNKQFTIVKIKFDGFKVPNKIVALGEMVEVREHVPSPLQCNRCYKYGHTAKFCEGVEVCGFCSSTDHATTWNCGPAKCVNCGDNHHAKTKKCKYYEYNTEIKLLQTRKGMTAREAKYELSSRGIPDPSTQHYAETTKQKNNRPTKQTSPVSTQNRFEILETQGSLSPSQNSQAIPQTQEQSENDQTRTQQKRQQTQGRLCFPRFRTEQLHGHGTGRIKKVEIPDLSLVEQEKREVRVKQYCCEVIPY